MPGAIFNVQQSHPLFSQTNENLALKKMCLSDRLRMSSAKLSASHASQRIFNLIDYRLQTDSDT